MRRKQNTGDRRVRRTKKNIRKAFLTLLAEKEYNQITVVDIIKIADYNRATFYRHYHDKDDLVNEIIDNQIDLLIGSIIENYTSKVDFDIRQIKPENVTIFIHVTEQKDFYKLWKKLKSVPNFTNKFIEALYEFYDNKATTLKLLESNINESLHVKFYVYGIAGLLFDWIENDFYESPEYMSEQLSLILRTPPGQLLNS